MKYADDQTRVEINLPFPGFYHSWLDQELDHQAESFVEYEAEYRQEEEGIPPELRLDATTMHDIMFDCRNYQEEQETIAKAYVEDFNEWVHEGNTRYAYNGIDLQLQFADMTSPRYYNFETDRLFATIPMRKVRLLFALSKRDKHQTLRKVLKDRHTSYDGFHSYYTNELEDWLEKPLEDWDHNELHSLLVAAMTLLDLEDDGLMYRMLYGETFYLAWSDAMDWTKWKTKVQEKRDEILEELRAEEPDYEPPYRCTETPDLFTGA